jgi:A/G-specific adenine glycosylase
MQIFSPKEQSEFRSNLIEWFDQQQRDLPWRRTNDPYAIWISEIMLQQTRVTAAIPFYQRFLERFPTVEALAEAPESDLLAYWAGLGYYYRARNLHRAAQKMKAEGGFPRRYDGIRGLTGVGNYTAAAIASIAFNLPYAAVDGNVLRVLSRVYADETDIAKGSGRRHFARIADHLLDRVRPGGFNQAMMELGATVCLPLNPQCLLCPVSDLCRARSSGQQSAFPVSSKRNNNVRETRTVYWIEREDQLLVWQRPADSRLMAGFWELPESIHLPNASARRELGAFRHGITFHSYRFKVVEAASPSELGPCRWISFAALNQLPASTILKKAQRLVRKYQQMLIAERNKSS